MSLGAECCSQSFHGKDFELHTCEPLLVIVDQFAAGEWRPASFVRRHLVLAIVLHTLRVADAEAFPVH